MMRWGSCTLIPFRLTLAVSGERSVRGAVADPINRDLRDATRDLRDALRDLRDLHHLRGEMQSASFHNWPALLNRPAYQLLPLRGRPRP